MQRFLVAFLLIATTSYADAPLVIYTTAVKARIRAKALANNIEWTDGRDGVYGSAAQASESTCAYYTRPTAGQPDNMPPVYAPREPIVNPPPGYVEQVWEGGQFYELMYLFSACYYALINDNPTEANRMRDQALKILNAASSPAATVTAGSIPPKWRDPWVPSIPAGSLATRPVYYVSGDGPGGQARVYQNNNWLTAGTAVTLQGVLGCTSANVTGKVGLTNQQYWDLVQSDGVTPVVCNATGTNYNHNFIAYQGGYNIRNYANALIFGYSWFYQFLDAPTKTRILTYLNHMLKEFGSMYWTASSNYPYQARNNFSDEYFGLFGHAVLITAADNPEGAAMTTAWNTLWNGIIVPYYSKWLQNRAGAYESWHYQNWAFLDLLHTQLELGTDNTASLPWVMDLMKYYIQNTYPSRTHGSLRGFNFGVESWQHNNVSPWSPHMMWLLHDMAKMKSDSFAAKFNGYVEELDTFNRTRWEDGRIPAGFRGLDKISRFLYRDTGDAIDTNWRTEPLSDFEGSNPAGGYNKVVARSAWTDDAVFLDYFAGPYISNEGNAKEHRDQGSILLGRGEANLLVAGTSEGSRQGSNAAWAWFNPFSHPDSFGIFYTKNITTGVVQTPRINSSNLQPANDTPAPYGSTLAVANLMRIDRAADAGSYVYSRGINQHKHWTYDPAATTVFPYVGWTRELLYLRPGIVVVYDRTNKVSANYYQYLAWLVGKTPTTAAYGSGMYRTEVSGPICTDHGGGWTPCPSWFSGSQYKGALTYVYPTSMPAPTVVDLSATGVHFQIQTHPADDATAKVNWLTVLDTADAQANLAAVGRFTTHSNVDVIRLGTSTVVGFASYQDGAALALPMTYTMSGVSETITHRIAGLNASTTYNVLVAGNDVTIAASGAGDNIASTAAGVLVFQSGAGAALPVTIDTSSLPGGVVGIAYSQTISASGGDGGPYTCAVDSGTVPTGLTLNSNCTLTGTPTTPQTANFDVVATDGSAVESSPKSYSVVIAANVPVITTTQVSGGVEGQPYTACVSASFGVTPYVFLVQAGALPGGITLDGATGCLSGTPNAVGVFTFTIRVTDDLDQTDDQAYSTTVVSSGYVLTGQATPGSNSVVVSFGSRGLPVGTPCTVDLLSSTNAVISTVQNAGTYARRQVYFDGLVPETIYGALVSCQWVAPSITLPFKTNELSTGGTISWPLRLVPSTFLTDLGVDRVTVEYNLPGVAASSVSNNSCGAGCTVTLTLTRGVNYEIRHIWKNASSAVVSTSRVMQVAVP